MVVDPNTGMAVEQPGGNTQSLSGQYGSTMGQAYGVEMPLYYDAMEAIPPAWATGAWNMGRTRNTILANRTAGRIGRNAGGLRQTFSPFRMGSLADLSNIDPEVFGRTRPARKIFGLRGNPIKDGATFAVDSSGSAQRAATRARPGYTPFNILSNAGNSGFANTLTGGKLTVPEGARAFAPGAFGTMTAMSSIASGSYGAKRTAKVVGSIDRFRAAAGIRGPWLLSTGGVPVGVNSQRYMSSSLGAARFSNAKYTGRAVGYFEGAQAARTGTLQSSKMALVGADGGGYFGKGVREAAEKFAGGSRVARIAGSRSAALGLKVVPFVGNAMLAYDITRFIGKTVGRGLKLGVEGVKSAQGDLIKPGPFGMGYQDNSVAATSRQRGVMAISNSRLNARSFLGQEGAYMHQAFG